MESLKDKLISMFCYLFSFTPIIFIITILIIKFKHSNYVKFHTNQALVLNITATIIGLFINIILDLPYIFNTLLYIIFVLIIIWSIINSLKGKTKEIPIIGKIRLIKN